MQHNTLDAVASVRCTSIFWRCSVVRREVARERGQDPRRRSVHRAGHVTPAQGVVLTPVTNFAQRDRLAGTVTVNSSVGMWKKLQALQRNPRVALAFHTRTHGFSARAEYVLVQGNARLSSLSETDAWLQTIGENWERFSGESQRCWALVGALAARLPLAREHRDRGLARARVARPGLPRSVRGIRRPAAPEPPAVQRPPAKGTGPRVDHVRAAKRAQGLADVLLGWTDADGYPTIIPVQITGADERGILLSSRRVRPPRGAPRTYSHTNSHATSSASTSASNWLARSAPRRAGQGRHARARLRAAHAIRLSAPGFAPAVQARRRIRQPSRPTRRQTRRLPRRLLTAMTSTNAARSDSAPLDDPPAKARPSMTRSLRPAVSARGHYTSTGCARARWKPGLHVEARRSYCCMAVPAARTTGTSCYRKPAPYTSWGSRARTW